jgi:hypothetical protein
MAMHDLVEDRFWEHMDSQMTRLEALLLVEEAASSLETEHLTLTSTVEDAKPQARTEENIHGAQGTQHQHTAVLERSFNSAAQLRSEDEGTYLSKYLIDLPIDVLCNPVTM